MFSVVLVVVFWLLFVCLPFVVVGVFFVCLFVRFLVVGFLWGFFFFFLGGGGGGWQKWRQSDMITKNKVKRISCPIFTHKSRLVIKTSDRYTKFERWGCFLLCLLLFFGCCLFACFFMCVFGWGFFFFVCLFGWIFFVLVLVFCFAFGVFFFWGGGGWQKLKGYLVPFSATS